MNLFRVLFFVIIIASLPACKKSFIQGGNTNNDSTGNGTEFGKGIYVIGYERSTSNSIDTAHTIAQCWKDGCH